MIIEGLSKADLILINLSEGVIINLTAYVVINIGNTRFARRRP
jgi:hypothetical protein